MPTSPYAADPFRATRSLVRAATLLALCLPPQHTAQAQYCWPSAQMACFYGDMITRVVFADMDHADALCSDDAHGKKDFTFSVAAATVVVGETYPLRVDASNALASGTERLRAWLDQNGDGTFSADESVDLGIGTGNATLYANIAIRHDAQPGLTRLRIMYRRTSSNPLNATDACHAYGNYRGQVKDYAVRITSGGALPVELLGSAVSEVPDGWRISWSTASETDNDHFTVHCSPDAVAWTTVATVPGAGNSSSPRSYHTTDAAPRPGIRYYRLSQTDHNGHTTILALHPIGPHSSDAAQLFPNPCGDHLHLRFQQPHSWEVVDQTTGRAVQLPSEPSGTLGHLIDTRGLSAGPYLLRIQAPGTQRYIRFLKQ